jgi:hypothetical protein
MIDEAASEAEGGGGGGGPCMACVEFDEPEVRDAHEVCWEDEFKEPIIVGGSSCFADPGRTGSTVPLKCRAVFPRDVSCKSR